MLSRAAGVPPGVRGELLPRPRQLQLRRVQPRLLAPHLLPVSLPLRPVPRWTRDT